jgi:hypothetical protein
MSPLMNKRDRIPNIVLTLPLDEALSDIEGMGKFAQIKKDLK